MNYLDEKKLEVMKMVVNGEKSIAWAAAKLKRSEKKILQHTARFARGLANFTVTMLSWQFLHSLAHSASQATV